MRHKRDLIMKNERFQKILLNKSERDSGVIGSMAISEDMTHVMMAVNKKDGILFIDSSPNNVSMYKINNDGTKTKEKALEESFKKEFLENAENIVKEGVKIESELGEASGASTNFGLGILSKLSKLKTAGPKIGKLGKKAWEAMVKHPRITAFVAGTAAVPVLGKVIKGAAEDVSDSVDNVFRTKVAGDLDLGTALCIAGGVFIAKKAFDIYDNAQERKERRAEMEEDREDRRLEREERRLDREERRLEREERRKKEEESKEKEF